MEITGFTNENIENYVQNFFNQMKHRLYDASSKSDRLLSYLRSMPSVWGVAHIPLLLELICSLWSNHDLSQTEQLTRTRLYTGITEWLCRRYLSAQDNQILQLPKDKINRRCQKELAFLESLAFHAMEANTIIIRPALLQEALNEARVSLEEHPHILNIGILKSFHKQGIGNRIEMEKDHYFVHLSFQEYFAARYLIHAPEGSQMEQAIQFIKHQKYNQRYTLLFTFAAGLLSEKDARLCLNFFWNTLLGEPLDIVGIRHMRLVIACIAQTTDEATIPQRSELLKWIANCVKFSIITQNKTIYRHLVYLLKSAQSITCDSTIMNMLNDLLQHHDVTIRTEVFSFIGQLKISKPSTVFIRAMVNGLNDKHQHVRVRACLAFGEMGEKPATNEVITKLVSALGDESYYVRSSACEVLGTMGDIAAPNELIAKLVSALGDESGDVRSSACEVLGKMSEKAATNGVITKLVGALGDESEVVRRCACLALGRMGEKVATNAVIIKLVGALGDESEVVRRCACLVLGRMGEKVATNEVITKLVTALGDESEDVRRYACFALGRMGEKAATNEVITQLVSALGDESKVVRSSACEVLGKMSEKAATNEVITKLVGTLGDESEDVRRYACFALREMGEKAATNEVITKLVTALGDESKVVRSSACKVLGKMGDKAATNEVITKLVGALGDESEVVRRCACLALGRMGEQAATNEVDH